MVQSIIPHDSIKPILQVSDFNNLSCISTEHLLWDVLVSNSLNVSDFWTPVLTRPVCKTHSCPHPGTIVNKGLINKFHNMLKMGIFVKHVYHIKNWN